MSQDSSIKPEEETNTSVLLDEKLRFAAQDLSSPLREERESAERVLLEAKRDCIPYLVQALKAPAPPFGKKQIGRIALLLGALRAREALNALFDVVKDNSVTDEHRAFIARALAEILDGRDAFDDRARAALETLAKAEDRYTRAFTAKAFGQLGDERSMARVKALCSDDDEWVREQAQRVLAEYEQACADIAVDDESNFSSFANLVNDANERGGDLAVWVDDLGDSRRAVRDAAVAALMKAGKRSIPFLIDLLNQPAALPKIGAATVLGRLQATEAVAYLVIAATANPITKVEKELVPVCLRSLANCLTGEEDGVAESLLPLAKNNDRFVRAGALICLGRLSDRRGLPLIVDALRDKDPFVVESASIALSEGAREADVDLVQPLLLAFDVPRKKDPQVLAEAILIALTRIHIEHPGLRVQVRHRVRKEIIAKTAAARKAAIALLEDLFAHDDPPSLPLIDDVLIALRDRHPEVRVVAASFLSKHLLPGFTGASKALKEAIFRKERTLALLCIEALRKLNTDDARATLEALTAFEDAAVATRAAELLDGFSAPIAEWHFAKKNTVPTALVPESTALPSLPRRINVADAQKPSRVRGIRASSSSRSQTKEAPIVDAKEAPIVDAKEAPIVDAKEAPIVDAKEAPIVDAKEAPNLSKEP